MIDFGQVILNPQMDRTGKYPVMTPQGQVAMYPAPIPMKGPNGMPIMENGRHIMMYPMLDPQQNLYRDGNGFPMMECHILGLDNLPINYMGRPLMKHPMIDKVGKPCMSPQGNPVFYAAGIPMLNPFGQPVTDSQNRPITMFPALD